MSEGPMHYRKGEQRTGRRDEMRDVWPCRKGIREGLAQRGAEEAR